MAAAELAMAAAPRERALRYFFPSMAAFAVLIASVGFGPEVVRFVAGTFPIAPILHVHAGIMVAWLAAFALQAWLGATGRIRLHRQVGRYAVGLGWLACASMVFVEYRTNIAHPQWNTVSDLDWKLPGPFIFLTFGLYLAWAVRERHRPQWHKRLMTFAVFLSLDAALQRVHLTSMDLGFWPYAAMLNILLLVPMGAYDLRTLNGKLHPATVRATAVLLSAEAVLFLLWGTATWHTFALAVGNWIRS